PAQQQGFEQLLRLLPLGNVFALTCAVGSGRTTLLHLVHKKVGGAFLHMKDFMEALRERNPIALEETFEELVLGALNQHSHVIVDDLHLLSNVVGSCNHFYQRRDLLDAPLTTLTS